MKPRPALRASATDADRPGDPEFSAFVFKSSELDPKHRDRVAFLRIVSGHFERDMTVLHPRTGRTVRLSNSSKVFGRERETVDEAFAGDIVGIVGANYMAIGDTLTTRPGIEFREIPRFPPECFAFLHNPVPSNYKRFRTGLDQLLQEGVVHAFELTRAATRVPLLAAVGPLQFEIVQYRLEDEYGAASRLEMAPWNHARWLVGDPVDEQRVTLIQGVEWATDLEGHRALLFPSEWHIDYFLRQNEGLTLSAYPHASSEDLLSA